MSCKNKHHYINYNSVVFWLILFVSCIVRLFALGEIPDGIHQDEAFLGYNAFTLLTTGADSWGIYAPVYLTGWGSGTSVLYVLLTKVCFYLFGINVWALRLTQAVMGCLSCYVFYRLLKIFYNQQTALIGFFLIAIMPWSIMNSRWALDSNIAPVFWLLGFYFYCCAHKKSGYLFLSAIFYALTMYAYAGYWVFVLVTFLLQHLYLFLIERDKKTYIRILLSGVLFIVMILPLGWFVAVNYGYVEEYRSTFLSVPKLLFWRSNEIGLDNFLFKLMMLYKAFVLQNDGWLSNSIPAYGLFYLFTPLFMLIGVGVLVKSAREDIATRRFSFSLCVLLHIVVGFIYAALIYAFSNRANFLFFPLLIATTLGISLFKKTLLYIVLTVYLISFMCFSHTYFAKYNQMLDQNSPFIFSRGLDEALIKADELHQLHNAEIYIAERPYVYSKVLFFNHVHPQQYLRTVRWYNYPDPFIQAQHFLYFNFVKQLDFNNLAEEHIYIAHKDYLPYFQNMAVMTYGNYLVAYKK